jgi:hypothetical protein
MASIDPLGINCGCVGFLITDRDYTYIQHVFAALNNSLHNITVPIDLLITCRDADKLALEEIKNQRNILKKIRNVEIITVNYAAQFSNHYHNREIIAAICMQRNRIRELAYCREYEFLFFLDSDVILNENTFQLLFDTGLPCVAALYQPRWSKYICCGIIDQANSDSNISALQLLIDAQFLPHKKSGPNAYSCAIIGFGAMIIRKCLLFIEYQIGESVGGVAGEDVGFCLSLLKYSVQMKDNTIRPHFLAQHSVNHMSGGASDSCFIPIIQKPLILSGNNYPMLTQIELQQLLSIEKGEIMIWTCNDEAGNKEENHNVIHLKPLLNYNDELEDQNLVEFLLHLTR